MSASEMLSRSGDRPEYSGSWSVEFTVVGRPPKFPGGRIWRAMSAAAAGGGARTVRVSTKIKCFKGPSLMCTAPRTRRTTHQGGQLHIWALRVKRKVLSSERLQRFLPVLPAFGPVV